MKSLWFVFKQSDLLLEQLDDHTFGIPLSDNPPTTINAQQNVHEMECTTEGIAVKTYAIDDTTTIPATYTFCDLRQSYYKLPNNLYLIAGKCREINY